MKKILNVIKKILVMVGVFCTSIYTKVFGLNIDYNNMTSSVYGVQDPNRIPTIWKITRNFAIPLVFIIGIIIYFKKSKSSKLRKIITVLIILAVIILIL